ncbi:GMC family oxidoreductase [Alkalilimnicola ehrlichii]|uniref:GMC family oxidoreductase n=1 Tax=Alkalilimnicola ehrlichii TaxID=351052 RepID=UPI001C6E91A0|nr:GMC family oxidoreductase N-terminal domain-containing protein [Alkalilimnicola ehrlichii]
MQKDYDYVIVGGGSAGCVLANRLSADPAVQVLVLEAGPRDWNPLIRTPAGIIGLMRSKRFNWAYWTEPEPCLNQRRLFWPRGKTLGGSSAINAMCYTRGHASDYDAWEAAGCPGWNYASLLPYFLATEAFHAGGSRYHGGGGELAVSELLSRNPYSEAFIAAGAELGLPRNDDFNGPSEEGVGFYHVMQRHGVRCSNAHAFLHPVSKRPNLHVLTGALAMQLELQGDRVTGVRIKRGRRMICYGRSEVVLAAGAVNTPQLLLLSGIGPEQELRQAGVPVRHVLPGVGRNLQDHLDISVIWRSRDRRGMSLHPSALPRNAKTLCSG